MTLILSGTDGLSDIDGSAATPAVRGTDTNTGIFFPAADTIAVSTNGSERVRIDTAGITKFRSTGSAYDSTPGDGVSDGLYLQVDSSGIAHIDGYAGGGSTNLAFGTNSGGGAVVERMRIDSSGNVGIGTSSPAVKLHVSGGTQRIQSTGSTSDAFLTLQNDVGTQAILGLISSGNSPANTFFIETNGGKTVSVTSAGLFQFNNGYGSAATAYGCRAWVNFNGQSSAAIRGSGNISSITINGTGDWTLNFATAMPDANYAAVFGSDAIGNNDARGALVEKSNDGTNYHLAGSLRIIYGYTFTSGTTADGSFMSNVAIFR